MQGQGEAAIDDGAGVRESRVGREGRDGLDAVKGVAEDPGRDARLREGGDDLVAWRRLSGEDDAEGLLVAGGALGPGLGPEGQIGEGLAVARAEGAAPAHDRVEAVQLAEADGRGDLGHAVVAGGFGEGAWGALAVVAKDAQALGEAGIVRDHQAAFAGGDHLARMEAEAGHGAEGPGGLSVDGGADGAGRVLDDGEVAEGGGDGGVARRGAELVDDDRRPGLFAAGGREGFGSAVPLGGVDVDQDRCGAPSPDGVGGAGPGEVGDQHLVAGPDGEGLEGELEGRGAAGDGHSVGPARALGEGRLEGLDPRALDEHPAGQHLGDGGGFFGAEGRTGEGDHRRENTAILMGGLWG